MKGTGQATRRVPVVLAALAAIAVGWLHNPVAADLRLTTSTLLVMGGSVNPHGVTPRMQQELGGDPWYPDPNPSALTPVGVFGEGYIDSENNPRSPFAGWDFTIVDWPAQIGVPLFGMTSYGDSQRQGLAALDGALAAVLPTLGDGERVTAFGYSSSANVMVRQMRELQQQGAPSAELLDFILLGNPNRPNGGVLERFAGLHIPLLDVDFDGTTPLDTPYRTVDISWKYDAVADFPTYPLNLLAVANAVIGGLILHGNYFRADIDGARAFPDSTVGNITYITLQPPHLPLLLPLYDIGFPAPLLDLIEPALTTIVEWGYDRTVAPGTPQPAKLVPDARTDPSGTPAEPSAAGHRRAEPGAVSARAPRPEGDQRRTATHGPALRGARPAPTSVHREADRHERNRRADRDRR